MIFNYAHWIPGLIVIGLSFIGGLGAALWLTRNDHGDTDLDTQMADLDEQKDHLISLLKDLDEQKDRMDPEAYASQKTEYEQKAADVLRKRDLFQKELSSNEGVSKKQVTEDQSPALSYFAARPVLRKSLWAGATVLSMGALVTLAINQGTPDREQP
ncbi:hypothetical protein KAI87_10240, partial [Myxococcota bacterium]|nr:hypothetical protein [Myxococcota bacterium]